MGWVKERLVKHQLLLCNFAPFFQTNKNTLLNSLSRLLLNISAKFQATTCAQIEGNWIPRQHFCIKTSDLLESSKTQNPLSNNLLKNQANVRKPLWLQIFLDSLDDKRMLTLEFNLKGEWRHNRNTTQANERPFRLVIGFGFAGRSEFSVPRKRTKFLGTISTERLFSTSGRHVGSKLNKQ